MKKNINKIDNAVEVFSLGCPEFVTMVESENYSGYENQSKVNTILAPMMGNKIDTLVLGCTHFPIMKNLIQNALGSKVLLVDPGIAVSKSIKKMFYMLMTSKIIPIMLEWLVSLRLEMQVHLKE